MSEVIGRKTAALSWPRLRVRFSWYPFIATLSPALLLALWFMASTLGLASPTILPSPVGVATSFFVMLRDGYAGVSFAGHLFASLFRVAVAFLVAAPLGIVLGLLRGRYELVDATLVVPAELLRPLPPLGIIPLLILWFGIGEVSKMIVIGISVVLIVMLNTQAGVRSCPHESIRAARSLGASPLQVFRLVMLPSALPHIMTGLRVAMGSALTILVAAEMLGADRGLGFIVLDASNFFRTKEVFVGIAMIGVLGFMTDRIFQWMSRRVVHWDGRK